MLIGQELNRQFLLFEDNENPETPLEETTDDPFEDVDNEGNNKDDDDDDEDDLQKEE